MKAFIGITDWNWFDQLRNQQNIVEANFWQPSGTQQFRALEPGELFLFKLHSPNNFIVGGGFFAHWTPLPISMAWETFGESNGAQSLQEMKERVEKYRHSRNDQFTDYQIGCILLESPFFLADDHWIPVPADWNPSIQRGKTYDLTKDAGLILWRDLQKAANLSMPRVEPAEMYGSPVISFPRLGQGSFRVLVTDAYGRRCAITSERTLPALDAAHIKPCSDKGEHLVQNGVLLRRDLHALFDRGYMTISPDRKVEISRRIREEFENGKDYYRMHGQEISLPKNPNLHPAPEFLNWHNDNVFRG